MSDEVRFGVVEGHHHEGSGAGLGKRRRREVINYLACLKASLNLGDWTIQLHWHDPAPDGALAEIQITDGRKLAVIRVATDFFTLTAEEQKHAFCHELVHCHLHLIQDQLRCDLPELLGAAGFAAFYASSVRGIEHAVDGISVAIAAYMPDPPWCT